MYLVKHLEYSMNLECSSSFGALGALSGLVGVIGNFGEMETCWSSWRHGVLGALVEQHFWMVRSSVCLECSELLVRLERLVHS